MESETVLSRAAGQLGEGDFDLSILVTDTLDLGVVAGFGIFVALALLVFGRVSLRRTEARRNDAHHVRILET